MQVLALSKTWGKHGDGDSFLHVTDLNPCIISKCSFSSYWKIPRTLLMTCKWSLWERNAIIKWTNGQRRAYCYTWVHPYIRSNKDQNKGSHRHLEACSWEDYPQFGWMQWEPAANRQQGTRGASFWNNYLPL